VKIREMEEEKEDEDEEGEEEKRGMKDRPPTLKKCFFLPSFYLSFIHTYTQTSRTSTRTRKRIIKKT